MQGCCAAGHKVGHQAQRSSAPGGLFFQKRPKSFDGGDGSGRGGLESILLRADCWPCTAANPMANKPRHTEKMKLLPPSFGLAAANAVPVGPAASDEAIWIC